MKHFPYIERLRQLNFPTLKYHRLRGDVIEVFKITNNYYDSNVAVELLLNTIYKGKQFKLENYSFNYDLRKYCFCPRIVNIWNSLPGDVCDTDNLDQFKTRTDDFWQHQEVLFNYKSELSGTGNRSQI